MVLEHAAHSWQRWWCGPTLGGQYQQQRANLSSLPQHVPLVTCVMKIENSLINRRADMFRWHPSQSR